MTDPDGDCRLCLAIENEPDAHLTRSLARRNLDAKVVRVIDDRFPLSSFHVLVATTRHTLSVGGSSATTRQVIAERIDDLFRVLDARGESYVAFEHGPDQIRAGGGCIDHTHVHVVATPSPVTAPMVLEARTVIDAGLTVWKVFDSTEAVVSSVWGHYVWIRPASGAFLVARPAARLPSQFWRRWYGEQFGPAWDWRALDVRNQLGPAS